MTIPAKTTAEKIQGIPTGKVLRASAQSSYVLVRNTGTGYQVECGWLVEESYDDDYGSYSYQPFQKGTPMPWVGRRFTTTEVAEAARVYDSYNAATDARRPATEGQAIGSVVR